jgi:hypothetical protein
MIQIAQKMTMWEEFNIEDEHQEALLAYLEENPLADYNDLYIWANDQGFDPESHTLEGTEEILTPEDNGGQSTLEITADLNRKIIFQNA